MNIHGKCMARAKNRLGIYSRLKTIYTAKAIAFAMALEWNQLESSYYLRVLFVNLKRNKKKKQAGKETTGYSCYNIKLEFP